MLFSTIRERNIVFNKVAHLWQKALCCDYTASSAVVYLTQRQKLAAHGSPISAIIQSLLASRETKRRREHFSPLHFQLWWRQLSVKKESDPCHLRGGVKLPKDQIGFKCEWGPGRAQLILWLIATEGILIDGMCGRHHPLKRKVGIRC